MILDVPSLLDHLGMPASSIRVLVRRPGRLVLRADTADGPVVLKASADPGSLAPEAENAELLAAAGLPAAKVLARGEKPISFVVLRWIDGESLSSGSPLEVQREAGALLKRIHQIGHSSEPKDGQPWGDWMQGWLETALPWWGEQEGVDSAMVDHAWLGFHQLRPLLASRCKKFILFDGRPEHFIVRNGRIVGLIDLHAARLGDAAMDLGVMGVLDERMMRNVRAGYECNAEENAILDVIVPFYVFLRRLAAAEWHGRFGPRNISEEALRLSVQHPLTSSAS